MKEVIIYTDGSCSNNPGPGGWAAILTYGDYVKEIYGSEPLTTNNKMELTAAIKALEMLKEPCKVKLYSDSAYLIRAFNEGWVNKWMRNGWKTANGDPVENRDLWERLADLTKVHDVQWIKVKGHSDVKYNNRCDELARNAIRQM